MPSEFDGRPLTPVAWIDAVHIQPWRYPEAEIWSRLAGEPDLDALLVLLQFTEPDIFTSLGQTERIEGREIVQGEGAGWAMPAFTWGGPGPFNTDQFGCYYAARELETAVAETVYRQERLLREARSKPGELRMRALRGEIRGRMLDLVKIPPDDPLYDPDSHRVSQALGARAYHSGLDGILYASVRRAPHPCLALYRPVCLIRCATAEALAYLWDGAQIRVEQRTPIDW